LSSELTSMRRAAPWAAPASTRSGA
jgi:hypothetical protein